jgi:carboxylesterase type B
MRIQFILSSVIPLVASFTQRANNPTATLACGDIEGSWIPTNDNISVASFLSVPYATAPVGDLRWKLPQPIPCWTGIYNATAMKDVCVQAGGIVGSEDCLYLHVYVPESIYNGSVKNAPVSAFHQLILLLPPSVIARC